MPDKHAHLLTYKLLSVGVSERLAGGCISWVFSLQYLYILSLALQNHFILLLSHFCKSVSYLKQNCYGMMRCWWILSSSYLLLADRNFKTEVLDLSGECMYCMRASVRMCVCDFCVHVMFLLVGADCFCSVFMYWALCKLHLCLLDGIPETCMCT